ncbi:MAG: membrane protein insertion efficiency factor YidD [Neisseriales bacterium]|nr:MAG: membrane protein insertion efficiency factor YidD [Neisseriales bacterium]
MLWIHRLWLNVLLGVIRGYQVAISPLLPARCRYVPTCSEYAIGAIVRYGTRKGIRLAFKRILRCHPLGGHGYDPVP